MTNQTGPSPRVMKMRAYTVFGLAAASLLSSYFILAHTLNAHDKKVQADKARQTPELLETLARQGLAENGFTDMTYLSHRLGDVRAQVNMTAKKDGVTFDVESSCDSKGCYKVGQEPLYSEPLAAAAEKLFKEQGYAVAAWERMKLTRDASAGRVDATVTKNDQRFDATVGCQQGTCRVVSMRAI